MTKLMATALALAAFSVPALAADLPVRPYAPPVVTPLGYNWNGFYIGAHLGGAWASRDFNQTIAGAALVEAGTNKPSGIMGGTYQMVSETGENFDIEIPTFSLDMPAGPRQLN